MSLFEGVEAAVAESNDLSRVRCNILSNLFTKHGGMRIDLKHLKAGDLVFTGPNSSVFKSKNIENMKEHLEFYSVDWISNSIESGQQLELGKYRLQISKPKAIDKIVVKEDRSQEDESFFELMECQRETPLKSTYNQDLVDCLSKIEEARYLSGDFRSQQSYRLAISLIKAYPKRIESGAEAQKMRGIGGKIAYLIDEFLQNGTIEYAEQLANDEKLSVLKDFCKIHGVGPVTANKWYAEGIRSISEIQTKHLTTQQQLGLKYFVDFNTPMTRSEVENIAKLIKEQIQIALDRNVKWHVQITGGYSRGKELSNDLDLIIYPEEPSKCRGRLKRLITALEAKGFIKELIMFHAYDPNDSKASKKTEQDHYDKCFCVFKAPNDPVFRRVDLLLVDPQVLPFALLGWTGSGHFERSIRLYAQKKRGIHLNSNEMKDIATGQVIPATSEREIFEILGLNYIKPEFRNC